jgi:hypothetical protein
MMLKKAFDGNRQISPTMAARLAQFERGVAVCAKMEHVPVRIPIQSIPAIPQVLEMRGDCKPFPGGRRQAHRKKQQ